MYFKEKVPTKRCTDVKRVYVSILTGYPVPKTGYGHIQNGHTHIQNGIWAEGRVTRVGQ